jgi:hypothetical protein
VQLVGSDDDVLLPASIPMSLGNRFKKLSKRAGRARGAVVEERVEELWRWWETIAASFATDLHDGKADAWAEVFSERLTEVHPEMAWETGPGRQALSCSPCGEPD